MKKKDFFSTLKKTAEGKPSADFDKSFWDRFDQEFNPKVKKHWWEELNLSQLALMPAGAAVAIILMVNVYQKIDFGLDDDKMLSIGAIQHEEMLQHMDMLKEMENLDLTEQEWKYLLEGKI